MAWQSRCNTFPGCLNVLLEFSKLCSFHWIVESFAALHHTSSRIFCISYNFYSKGNLVRTMCKTETALYTRHMWVIELATMSEIRRDYKILWNLSCYLSVCSIIKVWHRFLSTFEEQEWLDRFSSWCTLNWDFQLFFVFCFALISIDKTTIRDPASENIVFCWVESEYEYCVDLKMQLWRFDNIWNIWSWLLFSFADLYWNTFCLQQESAERTRAWWRSVQQTYQRSAQVQSMY